MIKRGSSQIIDVKRGAAQIAKVLAGNALIWEKESASDGFPISDDFNDGVISSIWQQDPNPLNGAEESGGTFRRTGTTYLGQTLKLVNPIDFTGRVAQVTFSTLPVSSSGEQYFFLGFPNGKFIFTYASQGNYLGFDNFSGSNHSTYRGSIQTSGVKHRISHDAENNQIICQISNPGDFDNFYTQHVSNPLTGIDLTNCAVSIYSLNFDNVITDLTAFDDFIVY